MRRKTVFNPEAYEHGFSHKSYEYARMNYICTREKISYKEYCLNKEKYDTVITRKKHLHLALYSPEYYKTIMLKKQYGITLEDYNRILEKQNHVCAICGNPERAIKKSTGKLIDLAVDHCHSTGKVRGLLCTGCNTGLGNFKDDTIILNKALLYLQK